MKKTLLSLIAILAMSLFTFGQHWNTKGFGWTTASRGVQNIFAVSATTVWAGGYDGSGSSAPCQDVSVSTDGGNTWTPHVINGASGVAISMICAVDGNTAFAAVYRVSGSYSAQGVYKTTDAGATWTKVTSGSQFTNNSSFPDVVYFWDASNGFALGDPLSSHFEIYYTSDGGSTWTAVASSPAAISGEYAYTSDISVSGNSVWCGTNKGHVLYSTDKGVTWALQTPANFSGKNLFPCFKDANNGLLLKFYTGADTNNVLDATSDAGTTWAQKTYSGVVFTQMLEFVPGTSGTYVSVGVDGTYTDRLGLTYTFDDGSTWKACDPDVFGTQITTVEWLNDTTAWAGTFNTDGTDGCFVLAGKLEQANSNFFAADTALGPGGKATFTNTSTGITTDPVTYTWLFPGGSPNSSTQKNPPLITYNNPGNYNVTLRIYNAFGSISTLVKTGYIHVGGVGIDEHNASGIKVYPNPVRDKVTIESGSRMELVQIYNFTGQLVYTQPVNGLNVTISTLQLNPGIYNLKVKTDDGSFDKKIIVQ